MEEVVKRKKYWIDLLCFHNRIDSTLSDLVLSFLTTPSLGKECFVVNVERKDSTCHTSSQYICLCELDGSSQEWKEWKVIVIPFLDAQANVVTMGFRTEIESWPDATRFCAIVSWTREKDSNSIVVLDMFTRLVILNLSSRQVLVQFAVQLHEEEFIPVRMIPMTVPWFREMRMAGSFLFLFQQQQQGVTTTEYTVCSVLNLQQIEEHKGVNNNFLFPRMYKVSSPGIFAPCFEAGKVWIWNFNLSYLPLSIFTDTASSCLRMLSEQGEQQEFIPITQTPICVLPDLRKCSHSSMLTYSDWVYLIAREGATKLVSVYSMEEQKIISSWKIGCTEHQSIRFNVLNNGQVMRIDDFSECNGEPLHNVLHAKIRITAYR